MLEQEIENREIRVIG